MGNRKKVSDLNREAYYKLLKLFFIHPKYKTMTLESVNAYAILDDLTELSVKNGWINKDNEIYVKLRRKKMMEYLRIKGTEKMTKVIKELKDLGLIEEVQVGLNVANEIYICYPDDFNAVHDFSELLELEDDLLSAPEIKGGVSKIESQEFRKSKAKSFENRKHTKTNITKTNITSNAERSSSALEVIFFIEHNTHLKLSENMKRKVEKWDLEKTKECIRLFKLTGGRHFSWLEQIYTGKRKVVERATGREISIDDYTPTARPKNEDDFIDMD